VVLRQGDIEAGGEIVVMEAGASQDTILHEELREIFRRADMADLPAMSGNVRELLSLAGSARSAANDLAEVILRDYSLTNKVLRVVNSAYYGMTKPVNNVTRAVTIIGFDTVREIAGAIALFEDFVDAGVDRDGVAKVLTRSLLSGIQAKLLVADKGFKVESEEAFICALLHNFGQIMVQVYLPDLYQAINERVSKSFSIEAAAREKLNGLSFQEVGKEMARLWNLSPRLIAAMTPYPPVPSGPRDSRAYLQNLAAFTNALTGKICNGESLVGLLKEYKEVLGVDRGGAVALVKKSVELAEEFSGTIRSGLQKLKIHHRLAKFK